MERTNRIVGICLVRNEERFLDQVLANICEFCDVILIADHRSTDRTPQIAARWAMNSSSISYRRITHPAESHEILMPYLNTPTWIFAVDGDELYDSEGLKRLRHQLLAGKHDRYWRIIGSVLNCTRVDQAHLQASGYLSPPSRSITKLFNFNAITDWREVTGERLHGGRIEFKQEFADKPILRLHDQLAWEKTDFRCLHLCFLPRSSKDGKPEHGLVTRWNLAEQQGQGVWTYVTSKILELFNIPKASDWKRQKYCRGDLVTRDITVFLKNRHPTVDSDEKLSALQQA